MKNKGNKGNKFNFSLHGLNRALSRGFKFTHLSAIAAEGEVMDAVLQQVEPCLTGKELNFRKGKKLFTAYIDKKGVSCIKTRLQVEDTVFVVGLNPDRTPTVITTWAVA
ncbi:MAG: hypothetical protein RBQ99_01745 [Trichlorobacter sp.]|nr:hypothetical protein [Trichlorobacter sp.]